MIAVSEAEAQEKAITEGKEVPRLIVNISIDQLKAEYLQEFLPQMSANGLKKLLAEGLVYDNVSVPFAPTDRASSSAAIATGTTPFFNGVPSSVWLSRKSLRLMQCTADQVSLLTPRGGAPTAVNLVASTIGDELKIATKNVGKVYSVAPECDAAIMLAGHAADGVAWIDQQNGQWTSTTYYTKVMPEWVTTYNKMNPVSKRVTSGVHALNGLTRYADYVTTEAVNQDVTELALHCLTTTQMGTDATPDVLNVQYYAGTYKHQSVYDAGTKLDATYLKLDAAITRLVSAIQQRVGQKNVLFVVTSTGYFDEPIIDYTQYKVPSGTVYINRTANLLNMYLSAIYGQAHYVDGYKDNQIYISHKLIEQKKLKLNEVLERSKEMLILSDGITNAHSSFELAATSDPQLKQIKNGYNVAVCGDIVIDVAPGWKILNEDTKKTTEWKEYGFNFPIIIYGAGVKHEVVKTPVTIDQIAPTISKTIHIRAPNACKSATLY